jgi:carbon monoxide dehydrogenase subunit G
VLEVKNDVRVRVVAPVAAVWDELSPLDQLLRHIPEVENFTMEPDGSRGRVCACLSWGPLASRLEGDIEVVEARPPNRLRIAGAFPSLRLQLDGTFDVSAAINHETVLCYGAIFRCDHRLARRLRGVLTSTVENHVESLTSRLAIRAAQHAQAERRLRFRAGPGSQ